MEIELLVDRVDCTGTLAKWFAAQWPDYYAGRTHADIEKDFRRELNRSSLPLRLVAFEGEQPAGTVALRERAIDSHPQYAPGLGGLYVHPPFRGRGVATALVRAAMSASERLNLSPLHTATTEGSGIFHRLGWVRVAGIPERGEIYHVYRWSRASRRLSLREVEDDDLRIFHEHYRDPIANQMAAFTAKDPSDIEAYHAHWRKIRSDPSIMIRTIVVDGCVAGHLAIFGPPNEREVTYWLGREYWGKGIASDALAEFLRALRERPVYARAAKDNLASIRVLEKCGFSICGHDRFFANARGEEIDEVILHLAAAEEAALQQADDADS